MNSQEHSDIRRSVRLEKEERIGVQRLASDKFVVRRQDSISSDSSNEVSGEPTSIPDKFDQPSYDFMLPEGKSQNSTILAVVDFITRKHNVEPTFIVNFDENQWFDIGKVEKTKADNADVYKATVILKAGADVAIQKTEGGLYKFVVEAQHGDVVLATTNIAVDVLSLAPTTKRVRVTVPSEPKVMSTTSSDSDYEDSMATTSVLTLGKASDAPDVFNSSDDDLTTPLASTSSDATSESVTESSMTSSSITKSTPSEDSEEEEEVEVPESEGSGEVVEFPTFGTDAPASPAAPEDVTPSSKKSSESEDVQGSGALLTTSTSTKTPESFASQSESSGDTESSEQLLTPTTSSESESSPESDSESPLAGAITILPLRASSDGRIDPIDAHLELVTSSEGPIQLPSDSRNGDVIRNVHVALRSQNLTKGSEIKVKIIPEGFLTVRPSKMMLDEEAWLFIESLEKFRSLEEDDVVNLEVVATIEGDSEAVIRTPIRIQKSPEFSDNLLGSEMLSLRTVEFGLPESSESGRTIGSIEGDMQILKSSSFFSLVGNDIILTCSQFSTDKCLQNTPQKTFTMILMPKNGTLAPLEVTIRVQQRANLRTSDEVIRISDNRIISPFAVITERTMKRIKLDGDGAKFLGFVKAQEGLYQLIVINSAPSGRYQLDISLEDLDDSLSKSINVFVENSLSHAHFRKAKYEVEIDGKDVKLDKKLTQVELEGVPIDEAKIMVLDGNPGWVTVESYGGRVKVGKFDGPIYTGKFPIRIGAVDKKTWTILTETLLELNVVNGEEKVAAEPERFARIMEKTFDREKTEKFVVELENDVELKVDPKSIFGIDENGQRVPVVPTFITLQNHRLTLDPEPLKSLRLLSITLTSDSAHQKLTVLIRLISSPEYLETVRKNAARPIFPDPWTREDNVIHVEMREELEKGQVVGVFPAVAPISLEHSGALGAPEDQIVLEGAMADAFDFDSKTGELKIKQRIDFETLSDEQKTFDLKLTTGEVGFESIAVLRVKVVDVDDNSPVIEMGDVEEISLLENVPAGTKIAEFNVSDPDGSDSYTVKLSGVGSDNYRASIQNSTLEIFTSENSKLDREKEDSQRLLIEVSDVSNNSDRVLLPIRILDVNDNAPEFSKKMYDLEVVEDWPVGVVLDKLIAKDKDLEHSGAVSYRLDGTDKVISINSTSGVVTVAGELWGMARDAPYKFEVVAEDSGEPQMSSTAILSLRVRGKGDVMTEEEVVFLGANNEVLVKENTPIDTKIYTVNAELREIRAHGDLIYSLKDLLSDDKEEHFAIDKKSGDVFTAKNIDFEKRKEYTLLITATNSEDEKITASRILKIHVENLKDNEPRFLQSANPIFQIPKNTSKPTAIGRLTAFDSDGKPIYYHILPKCGSKKANFFSIDAEFGEIIYHPNAKNVDDNDNNDNDKLTNSEGEGVELCFIATSEKEMDVSEVFFDGSSRNMRKIIVYFVEDMGSFENSQKIDENSLRIAGHQSISQIGDVLDKIEIPISLNERGAPVEFKLDDLQFVPANYELGRDVISPEGSVELNKKTGEIVANGRILDTPQGVYTAKITRGANVAVKQLHHIKNDRKLRYILAMSKNEFGANSEKLKRQILEAVEDKNQNKKLDVYFDEPVMDKKNSTWTSVCFYLTRDNAILDHKQMSSLISSSNGHIAKLHHIFKVVNVDLCAPRATPDLEFGAGAGARESSSDIPLNTLILIGVVGLLIIALVALLVYVCCVSRYQRYLKQKTDRMRCTSSAGSYYKSPNLIPPPGYMHTPPPPPPPAAIGFY